MIESSVRLCECGCGEPVSGRRGVRFRWGHWARLQPRAVWSSDLWEERDCGYVTPCYVWTGTITTTGYGRFGAYGRAHRISYEEVNGPIPESLEIDHLCRNPPCVRPDHLEPVTRTENARRAITTRLTPKDVAEIRSSPEPPRTLSMRFGVSTQHIWAIRKGLKWRH